MSRQVDDYIMSLPAQQSLIFSHLRSRILQASPAMVESLKYGVPFYTLKGLFAYLSPGKKGEVILGFCDGHLLMDEWNVLSAHDRKLIRHLVVIPSSEIPEEALHSFLQQQVIVHEARLNPTGGKRKST